MQEQIYIKGAREHNLKNVDITIPVNKPWFLPACPVRVNPRWRSIPFTPRDSAAMLSRCPPMRVSSSDRWKNPM